jgi:enoyl-CoA hydratase
VECYETLLLEKEGPTRIIILNRPERLNAINYQLVLDLEDALAKIEADKEVRCIILTGAGRAFCAGADIKETMTSLNPKLLPIRKRYTFFNKLEDIEKPVIAAINGVCIGGGLEFALCCDFRIAVEDARLGLGEVKLGVIPAGGGTARLPRARSGEGIPLFWKSGGWERGIPHWTGEPSGSFREADGRSQKVGDGTGREAPNSPENAKVLR